MNIELRNVSKHFGRFPALSGVSLCLPSGSRVALLGPNGSGKSTLIRAMLGLIECEGEVRLDGLSPFHDRSRLAAGIAYVPQSAPQLGATVRELTSTIAALRGLAIEAIDAEAEALELDLAAIRERPFRYLSGGMKQKLLAALAFATRPRLLILDEPTASLDEHARRLFWQRLRERGGPASVLLCSHRVEEAGGFATRVLELREGRLVRDELMGAALLPAPDPGAAPHEGASSSQRASFLPLAASEARHA